MLPDRLLLLLARMHGWLSGLEFRVTLRRLRREGHRIPDATVFGRRVSIHCAAGSILHVGEGTELGPDSWVILEDGDAMDIGARVFIAHHVTLGGTVSIGDDTLIAGFVSIVSDNHEFRDPERTIREQGARKSTVAIGRDVWIGTGVVVLPGVHIGDGAVIGANSTVTRDIPPGAIAVGSPARVVGQRGKDAHHPHNV